MRCIDASQGPMFVELCVVSGLCLRWRNSCLNEPSHVQVGQTVWAVMRVWPEASVGVVQGERNTWQRCVGMLGCCSYGLCGRDFRGRPQPRGVVRGLAPWVRVPTGRAP